MPPDDIISLSREKKCYRNVLTIFLTFFFFFLSLFSPTRSVTFPLQISLLSFTMAKSIRASVSKRNRATLRKNFFGPIVDARTERLHAKLQELADKPRPEAPEKSKREQAEVEAGRCIAHYSRI